VTLHIVVSVVTTRELIYNVLWSMVGGPKIMIKRIFTSRFEKSSSCVTMSSGLRPECSGFNKNENENENITKIEIQLKITNNNSPKA
jgi:hypothetical protein